MAHPLKSVLRAAVVRTVRASINASGETGRRLLAEATSATDEPLIELVIPIATVFGPIKFYCLGEVSLYRARTLLTKEPETIDWINSFQRGDTLWDIGANVGLYSLYAAKARNCNVIAFEPSAANYFLLNRNIEINGFTDQIKALCIAVSDETTLSTLNMRHTGLGYALSGFDTSKDENGNTFDPKFKQGMIGISVDDLIEKFRMDTPNHLKIDVDGNEDRIIASATNLLNNPKLKSISIELDDSRHDYTQEIISKIEAARFSLNSKLHAEEFYAGMHANIFNYQFKRSTP